MEEPKVVRFYLEPSLRESAQAGEHNFISKIVGVLEAADFRVEFKANTTAERVKAPMRAGFAMFHMEEPTHDRALTMRRVYHYPFWQIERSGKRCDWTVAKSAFDSTQVDRKEARRFTTYWRARLFADVGEISRDGFVYVPLQGRLQEKRSFQTCSPLEMIDHVLEQDPARRVIATLHPNETYGADDMAALEAMIARHPRLEVRMGDMAEMLRGCDYVVTQNSSAGFNGYFFGKPLILFAEVDFHHIAAKVSDLGIAGAFEAVRDMTPDFEGYLWWFWQQMSINAGRSEASEKIAQALRRGGWPI